MIGREKELKLLKALLAENLNILVEGGVGVGKTTLIVQTLAQLKKKHIRIDGDARFTEDKLVGWFEPSKIIKKGYGKESFQAGPLVECMLEGKVLFINELNRLPEGVQNLLLPAIDEGEIQVAHIGTIKAKKGFLVVGTQNPSDFVATSDLSEALKDRFEYLPLKALTQKEMKEVVQNQIKTVSKSTLDFIESFLVFTAQNKNILNGSSLRIVIGLAKIYELLSKEVKGEELIKSVATIALKNRLHLSSGYSFDQFLDDLVKKKA
jgi:MoxR-like ATPase